MRLDTWNELDNLTYDRQLLSDLTTLRFTEAGHNVLILGPVGVGKTHLATALGHIAIRRRLTVHAARADKLFTRLRAARLDNTLEAEFRRLARVDLLILDDFALDHSTPPKPTTSTNSSSNDTAKPATIVTSNREPSEWLTMTTDALLAQSAVDRLTSGAHTLIIEGPSYRQRHQPAARPALTTDGDARCSQHTPRWSHARGNTVVPSRWQATYRSIVIAICECPSQQLPTPQTDRNTHCEHSIQAVVLRRLEEPTCLNRTPRSVTSWRVTVGGRTSAAGFAGDHFLPHSLRNHGPQPAPPPEGQLVRVSVRCPRPHHPRDR